MKNYICFFLLGVLAINACTSPSAKEQKRERLRQEMKSFDKKVTTTVDSLFIDSLAKTDTITFNPYEEELYAFYANRDWKLAWYGKTGLREHAGYLMQFLESAGLEGLHDSFPAMHLLEERMDLSRTADSIASPDPVLDVLMTTAFLWYSDKAWSGLPEEKTKALGWFLPRYHLNRAEWLDSALVHSPDGQLLSKAVFRQYYRLRSYLVKYDGLAKAGGWPQVKIAVKSLREGDRDSALPALSRSLYLHGDLVSPNDSLEKMDTTTIAGVKRFQLRHGMKPDGVAGPAFFRALNVSVEDRIEEILVNMERCRWMPSAYPDRYLIVNIPDFSLYAYDEGKQIWTMNVVVGKLLNETATFSGNLKYIVFNPYWVVPSSIIYKEVVPAMIANPNYLRKHNMELVDRAGKVASGANLDWKKYTEKGFPYTIRQKPGNDNSLGKVKFLFPNSFSIYLHDTPSRGLFKEEKRAYSHGCVRVGDPEKLANYLLSAEGWTPEQVKKALKPGTENWVTLEHSVPVYIVYFTAWVEEDGQLHFREDVYGRDKNLRQELLENGAEITSR